MAEKLSLKGYMDTGRNLCKMIEGWGPVQELFFGKEYCNMFAIITASCKNDWGEEAADRLQELFTGFIDGRNDRFLAALREGELKDGE